MSIDRTYEHRLSGLINRRGGNALQSGLKGVEKESLRVTRGGGISRRAHPIALGSALTNPHVTTDFSEALIELVTPTFEHTWELTQYLCDLHQFVFAQINGELLWATSMPCAIEGEGSIPIANYGRSNVGTMKVVYRRGLSHRYGSVMQAISGVHFNYSFPEAFWPVFADLLQSREAGQAFRSRAYFALLRNYRRLGWLVLYLFGNSPALCESFLCGRKVEWLEELVPGTVYSRYGTTLRMSDLGYTNRSQAGLDVSLNDLDHYVRDLERAISTPHPAYQKIGVKVDGEYRQLNANLLQIENEYYSFIRPKRVIRPGERPTCALKRGGVQYVEMRSLDVSVFDPVGVNQNTLRFLEAFAAFCVLRESPPMSFAEQQQHDANSALVAKQGRRPGLCLWRDGRDVPLMDWALEILESMKGVCEVLDDGDTQKPYAASLALQIDKARDAALTPSAQTLEEMRVSGESFFNFALRMSRQHKEYFLELQSPNPRRQDQFAAEAAESLRQQSAIEASDTLDFDEYLARYFAN
jgi:glutamate--cysteine ligase